MVPVGGAVIAGFDEKLVKKIRQNYPGMATILHYEMFNALIIFISKGRASSSQLIDVFITLLSMGSNGYTELLRKRKENYQYLKTRMTGLAVKFGEHVIETPGNQISIGESLS